MIAITNIVIGASQSMGMPSGCHPGGSLLDTS